MSVNVEDIVLHNFREYVKSAKHILVITGAGLSAASGKLLLCSIDKYHI